MFLRFYPIVAIFFAAACSSHSDQSSIPSSLSNSEILLSVQENKRAPLFRWEIDQPRKVRIKLMPLFSQWVELGESLTTYKPELLLSPGVYTFCIQSQLDVNAWSAEKCIPYAVEVNKTQAWENFGTGLESLSVHAGLYLPSETGDFFYGLTRSGPLRFFRYNLSSFSVDKVFSLPGSTGAWGITHYNGWIYIGTHSSPFLYRYEIITETLELLASIPGETHVWSVVANENKVFLGTYPSAKVYQYDLNSNELSEFASFSEYGKYVRSLSLYQGKLYIGTGIPGGAFIEKNIASGAERNLLPAEYQETDIPYHLAQRGNYLFIGLSPSYDVLVYDLENDRYVTSLSASFSKLGESLPSGLDGNILFEGISGIFFEYNPLLEELHVLPFPHNVLDFSLVGTHLSPEGFAGITSYGTHVEFSDNGQILQEWDLAQKGLEHSPIYPMSLAVYDQNIYLAEKRLRIHNPSREVDEYGIIKGEAKVMQVIDEHLVLANYTNADVWYYDRLENALSDLPLFQEKYRLLSMGHNQMVPRCIAVSDVGKKIAIGSSPSYGTYGGRLTHYNFFTEQVGGFSDDSEHSIMSCDFDNEDSDVLYMGTSLYGGVSTEPLEGSARILKYNMKDEQKVFDISPDLHSKYYSKVYDINEYLLALNEKGQLWKLQKDNGAILFDASFGLRDVLPSCDGKIYALNDTQFLEIDVENFTTQVLKGDLQDPYFLTEDPVDCSIYFMDEFSLLKYY